MPSKLETDVRYLLLNCEEILKSQSNLWKIRKHVKSLDKMMEELRETEQFSSVQVLDEYSSRLQTLKETIQYEPSPEPIKKLSRKSERDTSANEIRQLTKSKALTHLRSELINDDLRQRKGVKNDDMGQAIQYYGDVQEKIAENMLLLTNSLKEQTVTANRIIKHDTEIVNKSSEMTNKNMNSLSKETERLRDHSKKAWKCWMWIMIALVMMVFISMVLLMKVAKKKS